MKDKCTKYEALFTFANEETLRQHIETCEDCRKEQEKMDKVSELIGEVKPFLSAYKDSLIKHNTPCLPTYANLPISVL